MLSNLSRKEIRAKMQEIYKASKLPPPSYAKISLTMKQFREKLKNGYTFEDLADDYPKVALPDLTFEGDQRYDDLIKITSGMKYPKILLDIVGTNKEVAMAFSELDHEVATFHSKVNKRFEETYMKDFPYKNYNPALVDWDYLFKVHPTYRHNELKMYKEMYEEHDKEESKIHFDHILDLYEDEMQELHDRYDKEREFLEKREKFYTEEIERSYHFYEKLPSLTLKELFEMEPELYELVLDDLERKIETVGWDPTIELTPEQQKNEELARRALGVKSLPDLPI